VYIDVQANRLKTTLSCIEPPTRGSVGRRIAHDATQASEALTTPVSGVSSPIRRERRRIARELHDQVVQELLVATIRLRGVAIPDDAPLAQAAAAVSRALSNARRFLSELRALDFESEPEAHDPPVRLADVVLPILGMADGNTRVQAPAEIMNSVALRARAAREIDLILREAVANAVRHARARLISCAVCRDGSRVSIEVADDGRGFDPRDGIQGFGLLGMAERASILGATFEVRSSPGRGTVVRLQLPPTVLRGG
jgi:signal transduction histidine kinase